MRILNSGCPAGNRRRLNSAPPLSSGGSQTRPAFSLFGKGNIFCFLQPCSLTMKGNSRSRPNTTVKWQSWERTDRSLGLRKPRVSVVHPRGMERWLLQGTPALEKSLLTWGPSRRMDLGTWGIRMTFLESPPRLYTGELPWQSSG